MFPISSIEPKGKPTPGQAVKPIGKPSLSTKAKRRPTRSQAAKPKLKPSVPTKAKYIPTPNQAATSKHAMIEESTSPSNRRSRIKRKPVTYEEDFDDSLTGEVSGLDIISASDDSLFMENFEKYKAFREVHGRAPYIHENSGLFHWCSEVRIGYKKRGQDLLEVIASNGVEITVGREALLRSVGFDLVLPYSADRKLTDHFADRIKALKQYKEKHGHLNPPSSVGNGSKSLFSFIHEVQTSYHNQLHQIKNKRFKLTDDKYDALNAVGFPFEIVYPISSIEPEGKPTPGQAAKPKLKPSVPTKAKHIPAPNQAAISKHAMIEESTSPSNRRSRIKRKPVTYEEDFDDSLIGEVSGSKRRKSLDPSSIVSTDNTSMSSSMISLDRSLLLSAITPLQSIVRDEFKCPVCLNACQDPYVVPECLHRFCGDCIGQSIRKCGTRCPECRTHIIAKRHLRPDTQFAKIVSLSSGPIFLTREKTVRCVPCTMYHVPCTVFSPFLT
jgi:hypothetical protein